MVGLQQLTPRRHVEGPDRCGGLCDEALRLRRQRRHRGIEVHGEARGTRRYPTASSDRRCDASSSRRLWNCTAATAESRASVALATAAFASSIDGGGVFSSAV